MQDDAGNMIFDLQHEYVQEFDAKFECKAHLHQANGPATQSLAAILF